MILIIFLDEDGYVSEMNDLNIAKYDKDFNLIWSYDYIEPNSQTINYAYRGGKTLVKILRDSYPGAIENNEDIYKDWK